MKVHYKSERISHVAALLCLRCCLRSLSVFVLHAGIHVALAGAWDVTFVRVHCLQVWGCVGCLNLVQSTTSMWFWGSGQSRVLVWGPSFLDDQPLT